MDNGGKEGSIDDSLLNEDEVSFSLSSQVPVSQKSRSLEDKVDRFFSEFAVLSHRIQNLEQKDSETTGNHISSGSDSVQVAKQLVVRSKSQPAAGSASIPKRSATPPPITRAEFDRQSASGQFSEESGARKRSCSQSSEEPDPDLEQSDTRSKDEDSPVYTETLETIKKWLDLEVKNVECFVAPSVFSSRDQVKKSVQQSMALPPAQPLVELWKYKNISALGSNGVDDADPHHPPLSKGQFLNFPKPQMKFYQVSPQSFSLTAPRIQDAFKNIAAPPYQPPSSVSAPLKQYLAWETVTREISRF